MANVISDPGYSNTSESLVGSSNDDWSAFFSGVSNWWNQSALNPGTWQKKIQDALGLTNATKQGNIAYTSSGIPYDDSNLDSRINAEAQELAYKRDDEAYDRLIAALKRNGINPAIALSNSASPMSSDTAYRSSYNMTDKDQVNSALKAATIFALLMRFMSK